MRGSLANRTSATRADRFRRRRVAAANAHHDARSRPAPAPTRRTAAAGPPRLEANSALGRLPGSPRRSRRLARADIAPSAWWRSSPRSTRATSRRRSPRTPAGAGRASRSPPPRRSCASPRSTSRTCSASRRRSSSTTRWPPSRARSSTTACGSSAPASTSTRWGGRSAPCRRSSREAELVTKLHAVCVVCGGDAARSQPLIDGARRGRHGPLINVGGAEAYEAAAGRASRSRAGQAASRPPAAASRTAC